MLKFLQHFTNLGEIIGIDSLPSMIDEAQGRNDDSRLRYAVGDMRYASTYPPGQFDLVVASAIMHWIKDQPAALQNIYNCMKPGGLFFGHTFSGGMVEDMLFKLVVEPQWQNFVNKVCEI